MEDRAARGERRGGQGEREETDLCAVYTVASECSRAYVFDPVVFPIVIVDAASGSLGRTERRRVEDRRTASTTSCTGHTVTS